MSWRTTAKHLSRAVAKQRSVQSYNIYLHRNLALLYTTPIHYV
jgi:hypothetical protein